MQISWHGTASRGIAIELGYRRCCALAIAIGNISVDLRHWRQDCSHAMTSMDPRTAQPTVSQPQARSDWRAWIDSNTARASLELGRDRHTGMFFLGLALHAVQDYEAHQGMTNAEHARRWLIRRNPDVSPAALHRGEAATRRYLQAFLDQSMDGAGRCPGNSSSVVRYLFDPPDTAALDMDPLGFARHGIKWLRADPPIVRW